MLLELFITILLIHSQVLGDTSSSEEKNVSSEDKHQKSELSVLWFFDVCMEMWSKLYIK